MVSVTVHDTKFLSALILYILWDWRQILSKLLLLLPEMLVWKYCIWELECKLHPTNANLNANYSSNDMYRVFLMYNVHSVSHANTDCVNMPEDDTESNAQEENEK